MLKFLKTDPAKKLQRQLDAALERAMHAQRNGDMRKYAELTEAAESIRAELSQFKAQ